MHHYAYTYSADGQRDAGRAILAFGSCADLDLPVWHEIRLALPKTDTNVNGDQ